MTAEEFACELRIPRNYAGYRQLVRVTELAFENNDRIVNIYRDLYSVVAQEGGFSVANVEKNIRTVLQAAWQRGDYTQKRFEEIAGYPCPNRPALSQFLDIAVDYLWNANKAEQQEQRSVGARSELV